MKINIIKPMGSEVLPLLSAFKVDNNTYVILDSEKTSPMGLPAIYVSKYTTKLEKINDSSEWESVKSYLKGIINGTNFTYVAIPESIEADEAYYVQLYLPSTSAFDLIKSHYVVPQVSEEKVDTPVNTPEDTNINAPVDIPATTIPNVPPVEVIEPIITNEVTPNVIPTTPIMPKVEEAPAVVSEVTPMVKPPVEEKRSFNFDNDKETFLKACENMFDALISKYQKDLTDLEIREQALETKEREIDEKLKQASEHLANAEAREQVANIAHDNAQKVINTIPNNNDAAAVI